MIKPERILIIQHHTFAKIISFPSGLLRLWILREIAIKVCMPSRCESSYKEAVWHVVALRFEEVVSWTILLEKSNSDYCTCRMGRKVMHCLVRSYELPGQFVFLGAQTSHFLPPFGLCSLSAMFVFNVVYTHLRHRACHVTFWPRDGRDTFFG